jgi:hypothetical protein
MPVSQTSITLGVQPPRRKSGDRSPHSKGLTLCSMIAVYSRPYWITDGRVVLVHDIVNNAFAYL